MAEERVRRRRRRRRRRGGGGGEVSPAQEEAPTRPPPPDWQWRTFPVFFAFVLGLFVMGLAVADPILSVVLFFVSLAGVAFGLAHIVTRTIIARRRR